ncbi:MAG TPA: DUF885 family protein [Holophagaceae bacterium]|nr:DUF885 family protein [Holophagaceae bacterium]
MRLLAFGLSTVLAAQVPVAELARPAALMPGLLARFQADVASLDRFWTVPQGPGRAARLDRFYGEWTRTAAGLPEATLSADDRLDLRLFRGHLAFEQARLREEARRDLEARPLVPVAQPLRELAEARRRMEVQDPKACAELLHRLAQELKAAQGRLAAAPAKPSPTLALRAAEQTDQLRKVLKDWSTFTQGYDPLFTWWCEKPAQALDTALEAHATFLKATLAGVDPKDKDAIHGDPIGREALQRALEAECIAYSPEEILEIGRREMAWCQVALKKAAKEMGCGEDWRAALEKVKQSYVAPGDQPRLIRSLALEAVDYLESRKLLRIPALAKEDWWMEMMSPERQKVAPFFLGGEGILVSYPTAGMDHADKLMSLRGNNPAFARATVHHELIPGHHLQGFMADRYATHRQLFSTPFLIEGWALYWELRLWDLGFARTPEERMGMLFWRMHRCARIFFSFGFHLGQLTPQQCVDLLVDQVGHERANAEGEVRRSLQGGYGPLYQAAYMLGGLQLRALHRELVVEGRMSEPDFHDAVLKGGPIPIEALRDRLKGGTVSLDPKPTWRFYGEVKTPK